MAMDGMKRKVMDARKKRYGRQKRRLRRYAEAAMSAKREHLEAVTQRELLHAGPAQCGAVLTQRSAGDLSVETAKGANRTGVKADGVGGVEDLPGELQRHIFPDL